MCTLDTESKDSGDLSPDDVCECGHTFAEHAKNDAGAFVCVAGPKDADDADDCRNFKLALTELDRRLVRYSGINALSDDPCVCGHLRREHSLGGRACRDCACTGFDHAKVDRRRRPPCRECGHGHPESMANGQCPRRMCECEALAHHPELPVIYSPVVPYRVTYELQGGLTAQVDVSGDASVEAIDGVLTVTHRGLPVLGILRVDTFPTSGEAHGGTDHGEQQGCDVPGR